MKFPKNKPRLLSKAGLLRSNICPPIMVMDDSEELVLFVSRVSEYKVWFRKEFICQHYRKMGHCSFRRFAFPLRLSSAMKVCNVRLSSSPILFSGKIILAYGLLDGPISITTCLPFSISSISILFHKIFYILSLNIVWFVQLSIKKPTS